jgi:Ribonuclease G/E
VAIDINTGKFVGKTARLEDTIVKTNLDAIPEIVRQIRLRDLGGIIIIDFIDMDERRNRNRVMAALEDELKSDRAPSKVLQFNDFGLVAITRKRVKQSLERTLSTTCTVCTGTGMVKSPVTVCNDIYIEMRKMHKPPGARRRHAARPPRGGQAVEDLRRKVAAGDGRDGRQDHPGQERPQPAPGAVRHPLTNQPGALRLEGL